jgi:hypothetical protein
MNRIGAAGRLFNKAAKKSAAVDVDDAVDLVS